MTNFSAYPVTVDGRRLDDLAVGLEVSALTLGGLRSGDQVLAGLDGEVASLNDAREPSMFAMGMLVKGTDQDGFVPAGKDGQATYQSNLQTLKHLLCKTGTMLDVRRVTDKADSLLLGTGGRTNLLTNPLNGVTGALTEVRRNYITDPHGLDPAKWVSYTGIGSITSTAAGAYSGATGLVMAGNNTSATPRLGNSGTQTLNFPVGTTITLQTKFRLAAGGWQAGAVPFFLLRGPLAAGGEWNASGGTTTALSGGWLQISLTATIPAGATGALILNMGVNNLGVNADATCVFHLDEIGLEVAEVILPWFTGGSAAADGLTYSWVGAANASESIASGLSANGAGSFIQPNAAGTVGWVNGTAIRMLHKSAVAVAGILGYQSVGGHPAVAVGDRRVARMTIRQVAGAAGLNVGPRLWSYSAVPAATDVLAMAGAVDTVAVPADGSVDVALLSQAASTVNGTSRFLVYSRSAIPAGTVLEYSKPLVEAATSAGEVPRAQFDATTPKAGWTGTPHASTTFLSSSDVRADAKVVDSVTPEDQPGDYGRVAVSLKVPGVYWRSVTAYTSRVVVQPVSGTAYPVPSLESSSAPIADAVVALTGPANAGVMVVDDATGYGVRLNEALPAGSVWRVNADTWESRVGVGLTVDSADTAGTDKSAVTDQTGTYPRYLRLHPRDDGTGRRLVKIRVVGAGFTAATTLDVKARRAHL